jgi:beta-lactamase superfamily II metal-dependent hydrolase
MAVFLILLDLIVWKEIIFNSAAKTAEAYFLNVGQGDSELVVFQNGVKMLVDAGPDSKAEKEIEKKFSSSNRYIDLAVITHPQMDHFGGLLEVLKYYKVGAIIFNGRQSDLSVWRDLMAQIKQNNISLVALSAGDGIKYLDNEVKILSPNADFIQSAELNDTALVASVRTHNWRLILTSDIGANNEYYLIKNYPADKLKSDILKIAHHGSKYSLSEAFYKIVNPKVAVIEVGINTYGHPSKEVLDSLKSLNIPTYNTLLNGTIKIFTGGGGLRLLADKL